MPDVYIVRGIPGAGKSTLIQKRFPEATICCADDFMVDQCGVFRFDPRRLQEVHDKTFQVFVAAIGQCEPLVVVDGTYVKFWQISPYIFIARFHAYQVHIIRVICDPSIAWRRNKHRVPENTVHKMHNNFEFVPREFGVEEIIDTSPRE